MYRNACVQIDDGPRIWCSSPADLSIREGDQCIIEADRSNEFGRVIRVEDIEGEPPAPQPDAPRIVRRATLQDQAKAEENMLRARIAVDSCVKKAEKYGFEMRLVRVRYNFDRSVLEVLFAADERLDVRELGKELTGDLRTRVDLSQIGVRDEVAIVGGMGPCGRVLCCCTWLHRFESINVKMAKAQGLSLNPGAISGNCGRLKCCLNYEFEHYRECGRDVPRVGAVVHCPEGDGAVVDRNILAKRVKVRLDDGRVLSYDARHIREK